MRNIYREAKLYRGRQVAGLFNNQRHWTPPDTNTQLHYVLDEATGATSWVNKGQAGTLGLTVGAGTNPIAGWTSIFTGGVRFLGVTDGIVTGNTSTAETSGVWTASMWIYPLSFTANFAPFYCKQYRGDGTWTAPFQSVQMQWTNAGDGSWQGQTTIAGTAKTAANTALDSRLVLARWQFVAITSDKNTLTTYKDGTAQATVALGSNVSTDWGTHGRWIFGGNPASVADRGNFIIDDMRFENVARSADYLRKQYKRGLGLETP